MLPGHKENEQLKARLVEVVRPHEHRGIGIRSVCIKYEQLYQEPLRDAALRCSYGSVRELLEMHRTLRCEMEGPDVVVFLNPQAPAPEVAATPATTHGKTQRRGSDPTRKNPILGGLKVDSFPGLRDMLGSLQPALGETEYVYGTFPRGDMTLDVLKHVLSYHVEDEGCSVVLPVRLASLLPPSAKTEFVCKKITLRVYSALDAVGLTAAVAAVLGKAGVPCNIIAAYHHDHIFVPSDKAALAMDMLQQLQREGGVM